MVTINKLKNSSLYAQYSPRQPLSSKKGGRIAKLEFLNSLQVTDRKGVDGGRKKNAQKLSDTKEKKVG